MASTTRPRPSESIPRQLLVGRDHELELLRQRLEAIFSGAGGFALVSGEAGIGKTALCDALAHDALGRGAVILRGHCFDLTTTPPYGPWLDALASDHDGDEQFLLSEALMDSDQRRGVETQGELFARVWAEIEGTATRQPVVLILEDLHWADLASIDLLRHIARHVPSRSVLLLTTYRVDDLTRRHPLYQRLPALVRETQPVRIDLKRLDDTALRELIRRRYRLAGADASRLVDYLARRSEGNPFYAGELLRALEDEAVLRPTGDEWTLGDLSGLIVPSLVLQVIETRLSRLNEQTRHLLTVAAVIGQELPIDVWADVSEADDENLAQAIEQAGEAHLLIEMPGGSAFRFTHALIREALYSGTPVPRRRVLHQRVAETLVNRLEPNPDVIAYHFQQAADPRAAEWLVRAGVKAQSLNAPQAAIACFTQALKLGHALDRPRQLACYRERGVASETIGAFSTARSDFETALDLARATGDRSSEWQLTLDLGMLWASRDYSRCGEYYQRALDLARDIGDLRMTAHTLNRLGNWHMNVDQPGVAQRYHDEALTHFRALDDRRGMAETLDLLGATMSVSGDLQQTAIYFREAIDLFRDLDDRQGLSSALATSAERGGAIGLGALVPAAPLSACRVNAEEALKTAQEIGWRSGEVYALIELGIVLSGQGEFGRARETLGEAREIAEEIEHRQWLSVIHGFLGDLYVKILAASQARGHCAQGIELGRQVRSVFLERLSTGFLALTLIQQSEMAEADRLIATMIDDSPSESTTLTQALGQLARAERLLAQRKADMALRLVDRLLARIPNIAPDRVPPWPAIIRGEALAALERQDEAEASLRMAIRDATDHGAQPLLWRAHLALGALYQAQARDEASKRHYAESRIVINRLADSIDDARLRESFRQQAEQMVTTAQAHSADAPAHRAFGLSSREVEVLRLVAVGLTDAEVAERLYVSRRTVTSHLTSIYNKLGVSTRTAAARLATEHGVL